MAENNNNLEGFNKSGFRDIELPDGLNQINNKKVKISQYCPALNEKSTSDSDKVFSKLMFSEKTGENWNNLNFTLDDLDLLGMRLAGLREALLNVGGAINGSDKGQGT